MKAKNNFKRKLMIRYIVLIAILTVIGMMLFIYTNSKDGKSIVYSSDSIEYEKKTITSKIEENDDILINPGKGFVSEKYPNSSNNKYIAVIYTRFNWSQIETAEGVYNWSSIDGLISDCKKMGKKVGFGVMCANISYDTQYVTPKWVFDAGAQGRSIEVDYGSKKIQQIIPIWTDPVFLEKLNNFITAFAKRYDGNSTIAYIDIRSYGNWGEQHNYGTGGTNFDITAEQLKTLYIQPYINKFKKTLLVNPWGKSEYNNVYKWAIEQGVTLRRDGILVQSDGSECAMAYGKLPTIYEYSDDYAILKKNKLWSENKLLKCVEAGKPSYLEFDNEMFNENPELYKKLANKIGYYFKLKQVQYTNVTTTDEMYNIKLKVKNEGVAPLYEKAYVYIGLLDSNDKLVKKYKTSINPQSWQPGNEVKESIDIKFTDVNEGQYKLAIGLYLNESDYNPTYLLGNEGKTNTNWYKLGNVIICKEQQITTSSSNTDNSLIESNNEISSNDSTDKQSSNSINADLVVEENDVNNENTETSDTINNSSEKIINSTSNEEETSEGETNEVKNYSEKTNNNTYANNNNKIKNLFWKVWAYAISVLIINMI